MIMSASPDSGYRNNRLFLNFAFWSNHISKVFDCLQIVRCYRQRLPIPEAVEAIFISLSNSYCNRRYAWRKLPCRANTFALTF
jgi:hypothetical protein